MTEVYSLPAPETSIPTSMSVLSWWFSGRMCSMSSSCIWCCWKSLAFLGLQTGHPNNCLCLHLRICVYVSPFSLTGTLVRLGPILIQCEPHLDLIAFAKPHFQINKINKPPFADTHHIFWGTQFKPRHLLFFLLIRMWI